MIDLRVELGDKWEKARRTASGGREWRGIALKVQAAVRFLAAIREPDEAMSLLIEAPLASAPAAILRFQAQGVTVADQRRPEENIFRVAITLECSDLRDVFEVLAVDLIEVATPQDTAALAITVIARRLAAWQACLRARRLGLSREAQVGLLGELIILQYLAGEIGWSLAIDAWKGPLDALHDFTRLGVAIEVKCALGVGSLLHISTLDQLESKGLSTLVVARVRFREDVNGQSLSEKIKEIRELVSTAPADLAVLNERLLRTGYLDADAKHYDGLRPVMYELYGFTVADEFPRLTTSSVPNGIVDGSYAIDERSISGYRVDAALLRNIVRSMSG
jgi:hypothetical protein